MLLVQGISSDFDAIRNTVTQMGESVNSGVKEIDGVTQAFLKSQREIESIASVAEQNAASVQEVQETIRIQSDEILLIDQSMTSLDAMSHRLAEMADARSS